MATFHEYVRLMLGLIISVVLGAWVAERYRAQSAQYDTAAQVFQSHSELLGERLSNMAELLHALKDQQDSDAGVAQMATYRAFLGGYNAKRNYNRAMIDLYFGPVLYNQERDLHYRLRYIGQELECAYKNRKSVELGDIDTQIGEAWESLSQLSKQMGTALRDNQIGTNRATAAAATAKEEPVFSCPPLKAHAG